MALSVPVGIPRSQTSNAEYAAPARAGFDLSRIGRANVRPALVLPLSIGQPAPEVMTARASRPDGTSDVGAMSVKEAIDDVTGFNAKAFVAPANEAHKPKTMQPIVDFRHSMLER
jgi:hypothetical protein